MEFGELKPVLRGLFLLPGGLLLGMLLGYWLQTAGATKMRAAGRLFALASGVLLWILSCNGAAVWLSRSLLPKVAALSLAQVDALAASGVQGIVVLGGGLDAHPAEYQGLAQPSDGSLTRLRYGVWLARRTGLPLGFSGGRGWSLESAAQETPRGNPGPGKATPNPGPNADSEAQAARAAALTDYGLALRWVETQSRDTAENARFTQALLAKEGVRRIALVTHASHMPRAQRLFEQAGLQVTPAPMGFTQNKQGWASDWLPSAQGLAASQALIHEWVGSLVM